jgi:hypothetical protein
MTKRINIPQVKGRSVVQETNRKMGPLFVSLTTSSRYPTLKVWIFQAFYLPTVSTSNYSSLNCQRCFLEGYFVDGFKNRTKLWHRISPQVIQLVRPLIQRTGRLDKNILGNISIAQQLCFFISKITWHKCNEHTETTQMIRWVSQNTTKLY